MRALKRISNALGVLIVAGVVLLAVLLVGVRVVGLTPFAVLSGSMEPAYRVGALIYVKAVDPADVEVGDAITFVVNEDLLVATHRVVDIEVLTTQQETVTDEITGEETTVEVPLPEPAYYFQTKGDANADVDGAPVHYKNLIGVPVFTIPLLGFLSNWLKTREGIIMGVSIALALIVLISIPDVLKLSEGKRGRRRKSRLAREHRGS